MKTLAQNKLKTHSANTFWTQHVDSKWVWDGDYWHLPGGLRDLQFQCFDDYDKEIARNRRKLREQQRLSKSQQHISTYTLRNRHRAIYTLRKQKHKEDNRSIIQQSLRALTLQAAPRVADSLDSFGYRVLKLTLHAAPFECTEKGEELVELREDNEWIRSRLYCAQEDRIRHYDYIEYYNAGSFSTSCPMIRVKFVSAWWYDGLISLGPFDNGFAVTCAGGIWMICQAEVVYSRHKIHCLKLK